jgi:serine/threonine-protein kinase HipA
MEFLYDTTWIESAEARPLSLSLPINLDGLPVKGDRVGFYFDNLLPDSETIRRRVQARFHTRSGDPFDLLEAVGRDCVGAIQLLPEGKKPESVFEIQAEPLDERQVERHLFAVTSLPDPTHGDGDGDGDDDFRFSVAGAQEKTALIWHGGRWCRPRNATPTTHILKLPLGLVGERHMDMRLSLENEWLCAQIFAGYGVPIASCDLQRFGAIKALVVTRFDRRLHSSGRYWLRLPQEDFCQATGAPGSLKYEADRGPGLAEIAAVLQASESRDEDLSTLLRAQLLFWMLGAIDGHAKNFSIHLLARGRYRLTPLYDVLSAWPLAGSREDQLHPKKLKLAMALRGTKKHYRLGQIQRRHFNMTARQCGLGTDMEPIIAEVIAKTPSVIESVAAKLPHGFPAQLFESITGRLRAAAAEIAALPPA